ncbi:glycosyltransferase [Algoriphagus winogradskyi]|uniref:Glycosyl transferases group 1 n=1 Tax=Algoriphagus winogradskyi TaxID=237017 RepID=A0ABY1NXW0_9BACT|nr:glycosyltransferase [Algoriphagus winogradskyi]SMP20077.1 Glycosyl transferases group 1 [Algoriphagus winogradskyi]
MIAIVQKKKISYLVSLDKDKSPGVYKKIVGTLQGVEQSGYISELVIKDTNPGFLAQFVEAIDSFDGEVLIIRSLCQYNFYLIPALIRAKSRGKKVILDIPTPNVVAFKELYNTNTSWLRKFKDVSYLALSGPVPFWFSTKILQYAQEGSWFALGNHKRTLLVGNGINVAAIQERKQAPLFDGTCLNLVCVASLNYWHGVDRLIKAMAIFNSEDYRLKIHLKIVGNGAVLTSLQELVEELSMQKYIQFLGFLDGENLYQEYEAAHLAVGSLALFRKNLNSASELKSREYCAAGIPFIGVGDDPDFPPNTPFRTQLPNRENINDLTDFFRNFNPDCLSYSPNQLRKFAWQNLDFSVKMKEILNAVGD